MKDDAALAAIGAATRECRLGHVVARYGRVDLLIFNAQIIETGTDSYRLASTRRRRT